MLQHQAKILEAYLPQLDENTQAQFMAKYKELPDDQKELILHDFATQLPELRPLLEQSVPQMEFGGIYQNGGEYMDITETGRKPTEEIDIFFGSEGTPLAVKDGVVTNEKINPDEWKKIPGGKFRRKVSIANPQGMKPSKTKSSPQTKIASQKQQIKEAEKIIKRGSEVAKYQEMLHKEGYLSKKGNTKNGKFDGLHGKRTEAALAKYIADKGLTRNKAVTTLLGSKPSTATKEVVKQFVPEKSLAPQDFSSQGNSIPFQPNGTNFNEFNSNGIATPNQQAELQEWFENQLKGNTQVKGKQDPRAFKWNEGRTQDLSNTVQPHDMSNPMLFPLTDRLDSRSTEINPSKRGLQRLHQTSHLIPGYNNLVDGLFTLEEYSIAGVDRVRGKINQLPSDFIEGLPKELQSNNYNPALGEFPVNVEKGQYRPQNLRYRGNDNPATTNLTNRFNAELNDLMNTYHHTSPEYLREYNRLVQKYKLMGTPTTRTIRNK